MSSKRYPSGLATATGVTIIAFITGFIAAQVTTFFSLYFMGGYKGMALALALSSLITFALPGLVARRWVVGSLLSRQKSVAAPLVYVLAVLAGITIQLFVEWTGYVGSELVSFVGWDNGDMRRASNEITAMVCRFGSPLEWAVSIVVISLLPAFGEELFFRGAMLPLLRRLTGRWDAAVVATAIIFSAIHMDAEGFLSRLVLGLLLGIVFVQTRSLWASMLLHAVNNLWVLIVLSEEDDIAGALNAPTEDPGFLLALGSLSTSILIIFYSDQLMRRRRGLPTYIFHGN